LFCKIITLYKDFIGGYKMGKKYQDYVDQVSPKPTYAKNYVLAFIVGGIICVIGQGINDIYMNYGLDKLKAAGATSMTLIFIGALLTGLGVYDLLGKRAGAGSIIPITGFANSIVSPAMEYKREGYVLGVGANLFKIAGPVLVYGIGSSVLCGFIYYIMNFIK
jgi:stage V sporulation protein AC